jgi:MFS family permease
MSHIPVSSIEKHRNPYATLIVLVVASTIISLSMGMRQSLGLFLPPLNSELGVSATAFGFAMALQNIVWGISQPIVGLLGDRYGARPVLIASALIYAAGLCVMGAASPAVGLDAGGGVLMGLGIAGTGYGVLIGSVSRAVRPERRNQMVGLVAARDRSRPLSRAARTI